MEGKEKGRKGKRDDGYAKNKNKTIIEEASR